jgi:hypothetical protein
MSVPPVYHSFAFPCGITIAGSSLVESDLPLLDLGRPVLPKPRDRHDSPQKFILPNILDVLIFNAQKPEQITYHINETLQYKHPFQLELEYEAYTPPPIAMIGFDFSTIWPTMLSDIRVQSYFLTISDRGIHIGAESDLGLYYGLLTLSQLIHLDQGRWMVQSTEIWDYPQFVKRGMTDQLCHGQVPTVTNLKKFIRFLSRYKKNLLGLNLEDIMSFDRWSHLGESRGALTVEEITELKNYARLYYLELFPGFQALGHLENFLYHSEFRHLAEFPGANSLNLAHPETRPILESWYREICRKFEPKIVHIEMDEAYDYGLYASREYIKEHGRAEVLLDHILWTHRLLHDELGKDLFMYHDTVLTEPNILDRLPKDIHIIYWNYTPIVNKNAMKNLVDKGFFVFTSPALANWSRPFPDVNKAYQNAVKMAHLGLECGARGFMNSSWGDFSNENLRENNYYGLAAGADLAWNTESHDFNQFQRAFGEDFFGMSNPHLMWETISLIGQLNHGHVFNTPFFHRLWEHPFGLQPPTYSVKQVKNDLKLLKLIPEYIDAISQTITRNGDLLDYLRYVVHIATFNAEKASLSHQMYRWGKKDRLIRNQHLVEITQRIQNLDDCWKEYCNLWRRCAKEAGLERIERNYVSLRRIYSEILEKGKKHLRYATPYLESEWICHPHASNRQKPHIFRKKFRIHPNLYSKIIYARIQGIANTYLKIRVNGREIGEVISRFYLSPVIFDNSVKIFDISSAIIEGENCIEIEGWEHTGSFIAINIYGEIAFNDGTMLKLTSNTSWAVRDPENRSTNDWKPAKLLGKVPAINGEIRPPVLSHNEPSWISRKFGERGYRESMIFMKTKSRRLASFLSRFTI